MVDQSAKVFKECITVPLDVTILCVSCVWSPIHKIKTNNINETTFKHILMLNFVTILLNQNVYLSGT